MCQKANGQKDQANTAGTSGIHTMLCGSILKAYFFIMIAVYPLYAPGGYVQIGEVKYDFFRNVTLVTLAAMGLVVILTALMSRDREWIVNHYRQMSVTDWFVYGYCLTVMLSYLCSAYKKDALWGEEGWYMGTMSQIMFVLLYFFFSRYFDVDGRKLCRMPQDGTDSIQAGGGEAKWLGIWLSASALVFLLGICNRYSLYPIAMEGQTETFISTLGNINWFCGYWAVTAPIGIVLYWCSNKGVIKLLLGVYSFIAMLSGVTQGSNSAYLVFLLLLFVLLALSLKSDQKLYRFLELCLLFTAACLAVRGMDNLPGFSYNYCQWGCSPGGTGEGSVITCILLNSGVMIREFLILVCIYTVVRICGRRGQFLTAKRRWIFSALAVAAAVAACIAAFLLMVDSEILQFRDVPGSIERDSYMVVVLNEDWGNGRGATWKCGIDAYNSMDALHKLVGIGPDCFADYIYDVPELAERMVDRFWDLRLTNAHNEWLTMLVNTGVLGLFCYVGIFMTAIVRYLRRAEKQPLLYVYAVVLLAYTVHNMVSFQQILHTPYMFMILGIGERMIRDEKKNISTEAAKAA